jgi:glyoxylase-like metal-dependent hydrolase (beta-lactamase superfamily II)
MSHSTPLFTLGRAGIHRVEEMRLSSPIAGVTGDSALIEANRSWLCPYFLDDTDHWDTVFQSYILCVDDKITVIDPCNGNGRPHKIFPMFDMLETPYIERFAATGIRPEDVDYVFCTHCHHDHCGWNTVLRDGRYLPTFPNARYLLSKRDYDRWNPALPGYQPVAFNEGVFERSLLPVMAAGLATLIPDRHRISAAMEIEPAFGHTLGHAMLHLTSDNREAYFTGDVFHHPLQLAYPELQFGPADDLEQAILSRKLIVGLAADRDALIIPAHLPSPHGLRVYRQNDVFSFMASAG